MLHLRILMRQSTYRYGDHDRQFSLVVVRMEGAERRLCACHATARQSVQPAQIHQFCGANKWQSCLAEVDIEFNEKKLARWCSGVSRGL